MRSPVQLFGPRYGELTASRRERGLHVALVISHLGQGGAERVICSLAQRWAVGNEVSLLTVGSSAGDRYPLPPGVRRVALDLLRPSQNFAEGVLQASRRVVALRRALVGLRPDLVVSFLERTNILALLATTGSRVPVFVCERSDPRHDAIGRPWAALRRLLYPRAAGVVVQTERVGAWARAFCPRVHVIPNFVERPAQVARPGIEHGPRKLLGLGRLAPEKGFDLLVRAFARVARSHPDWTLEILGEGKERTQLETLAGALGVRDRVSMPGSVVHPLPRLAAAHAFALPSRYEGFPNALLEAMACGLPVVAFDCQSGPREIIVHEKDGLLVRPGDTAEMALALDRLLGNTAERVRLGRNAMEVTVRFAPATVFQRWSALLTGEELP